MMVDADMKRVAKERHDELGAARLGGIPALKWVSGARQPPRRCTATPSARNSQSHEVIRQCRPSSA
jgi:hypothetical protein